MARDLEPFPRQNEERKDEENTSRSKDDATISKASENGDQGVIPHTTAASAVQVAEEVAQGLKKAVGEAVAWAEAKADKLSAKGEDGTGPYGSLATCAPSDFDAIATGVLPAMPPSDKAQDEDGDSGGSKEDKTKGATDGSKSE